MRSLRVAMLASCLGCAGAGGRPAASEGSLRQALTFHVPFDGKADAVFAPGDRGVYSGLGTPLKDVKPGLPAEGVSIARGAGRYGDALRFERKIKQVAFYKAERNMSYSEGVFQGSVSIWMSLDPEKDLEPGFCDPIQLTDKKWDDACMFVDFDKGGDPRLFRMGVLSDHREWNPQNRKWDDIPDGDRPWIVVRRHPFARGKWTHVVFTWEKFNTQLDDAVARLYLDGQLQGEQRGRKTYTWDLSRAAIVLGMNYVGLYDDLALFNRPLSEDEIVLLGKLEGGVRSLVRR